MDSIKNISSLVSALAKSENTIKKKFAELSSGSRINRASDDAAGLAIAESLKADAAKYSVANRNAQDAISASQIADGALGEISNINARLSEIATQAANGTLSDGQRQALNQEYQQLSQEQQRIAETTTFNGVNVLNGSSDISVQVGIDSSANSQITLPTSNSVSFPGGDVLTQANAQAALTSVQSSIDALAQARGSIGAVVSRIEVAESNNGAQREGAIAAESRIRDADIAQSKAEQIAALIRQESTTALIAQAGKLNQQNAIRLLS